MVDVKVVAPILAPISIGMTFSIFMCGILMSQVFVYTRSFPRDRPWVKIMVSCISVISIVHTFLIGAAIFDIAVTSFGDIKLLDRAPLSLEIAIMLSLFLDMICQLFYAARLWKLSGSHWMFLVALTLVLGKAVTGMILVSRWLMVRSMETLLIRWSWSLNVTLALATAGDTFVSVSLSWILWRKRVNSGFTSNTTKLIDHLIEWTVQTGLVIGVTTVTTNIVFITMQRNLAWLGIHILLPSVYSNSVMICLHRRTVLKRASVDDDPNLFTYSQAVHPTAHHASGGYELSAGRLHVRPQSLIFKPPLAKSPNGENVAFKSFDSECYTPSTSQLSDRI
ncbi:hypothetical protein BDV98DRAFT_655865 [Pterulicium gracile]|uniref:DUF6534 domain-containing protein n=1 Tax=Pterulicium gracile TaxID=1884261 RepID=A0A5C3QM90_9AGAR|nr:hypothetical protein BDV98DRAFT_655865 [Pterula gracilis]